MPEEKLSEDQKKFFETIASWDEFAIANWFKVRALQEFDERALRNEATYHALFNYSQWIERATKIILTLHRRDITNANLNLDALNRAQSHSIITPLDRIIAICEDAGIAPDLIQSAKLALSHPDVVSFLKIVEGVADAKIGRYQNLKTASGDHTNTAYTMNLGAVLKNASESRQECALKAEVRDDREEFFQREMLFIRSISEVITFLLHFPVKQGVIGERAKRELAMSTYRIPNPEVFDYLSNTRPQ